MFSPLGSFVLDQPKSIIALEFLATLILTTTTYMIYNVYKKTQRYAELEKRHDCGKPTVDPNILPGGPDHMWKLFSYRGDDILEDIIMANFKKFGATYCEWIMGTRCIHTSDPRNFQAMLGTDWKLYEVSPSRKYTFAPFLRSGLLCTDGASWKHSRDLMKPSFARNQLGNYERTEVHVQNLLQAMPTDASGWTSDMDILELFSNLTMDTSTEFFFGKAVGAQQAKLAAMTGSAAQNEADKAFVHAFETAADYTMQRTMLQEMYFMKDGPFFRRCVKTVHDYVDKIIKDTLDRAASGSLEKRDGGRYVFLEEMIAGTQDPMELRDNALTLLTAGRDTTANLLGWALFFLARYPQEFKKLRETIIEHLGGFNSETWKEADYPTLKGIPYLQWVLQETLRLHGVVSMTNRTCTRDTVLPAGGGPNGDEPMAILKDEKVFIYFYPSHRNEKVWGSDVLEFKPERWHDRKIGWDYVPFGGGPRVCIGQHHGMAEASYVLTRLCQRFDELEYTDDRNNYSKVIKLTVGAAHGVNVRLHKAEGV
ncbi:MAG: hypothetical protein MMC23_001197 [Stictis urceolatum]|nr:hypothetical protein [Stictis urceolata]